MTMKHIFALFLLTSLLFTPGSLIAQGESVSTNLASFRSYVDIPATSVNIKVPTVVEVPLSGFSFEYPVFAVIPVLPSGALGDEILGSYYRKDTRTTKTLIFANGAATELVDDNYQTFSEFSVPEDGVGTTEIILTSARPVSASSLSVLLDPGTALPKTIKIKAGEGDSEKVVVNSTLMPGTLVSFPKTTASRFSITFTFGQPLRITELRLSDENAEKEMTHGLRFLAQPGVSYRVFIDADRWLAFPVSESGNLTDDKGILILAKSAVQPNNSYAPADVDKDGVPDRVDNCAQVANSDQADINVNERGDACDDFDRDGVMNTKDNCLNQPNAAQTDTDGDGNGDACDKEESRFTEANKWVPWAGMGIVALVLVVLMTYTIRQSAKKEETLS